MSLMESDDVTNIYYVIPEEYRDEEECSTDMKLAFQSCVDHNLCPEWISEAECLKLKPTKKDVFVFEEFVGTTFKFLCDFKCVRIVGPRCILVCLIDGISIPDGQSPVFTVAMRGLVVTTTSFDAEAKQSIMEKVQYMGGLFTNKLRQSITHVVADSVCTIKHKKAIELNIPVMTAQWVLSVWEDSKHRNILATDPEYMKHQCPVFHGLVITCSGFQRKEKEALRDAIVEHGGEYCGQLESERTNLLIINEPSGDKYKYAVLWELPCVSSTWIYESIKKGHTLPSENYLVKKSERGCSTPEINQSKFQLNFSTISSITNQENNCTHVDESMMNSTMMSTASICVPAKPTNTKRVVDRAFEMVDKLDLKEAKKAGIFLDGCNVYLSGFNVDRTEKLRRVLNGGGATRFNEISESVTHVIVGDFVPSDIKLLKSSGFRPHVLMVEWLLESIKLHCPASEEQFSCFDLLPPPAEPPSPLSKKGVHLLQRVSDLPVRHLNMDDSRMEASERSELPEVTLVQQYLHSSETDSSSVDCNELAKPVSVPDNFQKTSDKSAELCDPSSQSTQQNTETSSCNETTVTSFFNGLAFSIAGFDEERVKEMEELIDYCGGCSVKRNFKGIPDYGVVPMFGGRLFHTTNEIVTDLWLECCYEDEKLVPILYYHHPLTLDLKQKPLDGCVIGLTTYAGRERFFITELSKALGAITQEMFARVNNDAKGAKASTHLICPAPEGSKYLASVKWKLPAVTHEWLLACARQGKRVDEEPYFVKPYSTSSNASTLRNSGTSERQVLGGKNTLELNELSEAVKRRDRNLMGPPSAPTTPGTPMQQLGVGEGTPNMSQWSDNQETPKGPGYVATPETPYGTMFKADPSPNTRKNWKRWINNFPEFPRDEPLLKKRRQSTPLSELKRQCWEKFGGIARNEASDNPEPASEQERVEVGMAQDARKPSKLLFAPEDEEEEEEQQPAGFSGAQAGSNSAGINTQLVELNEILTTASKPEISKDEICKGKVTPEEAASKKPTTSAPESLDINADFVEWVDPVVSNGSSQESKEEDERPPLKFMLSAIVEEREHYEKIIVALGGTVSCLPNFDPSASHLVCNRPARSEKLLASIASGKWVLHKSYLDKSEREGRFIEEEAFEWGSPQAPTLLRSLNPGTTDYLLAKAAHRWRRKLLGNSSGAFAGMKALIHTTKEKMDSFRRLIVAGGGEVLNIRPPFSTPGNATHCLVELNKVKQPVDMSALVRNKVPCVLPIFLNNFLITDPPPDPNDSVIPEYATFLQSKH